WLVAKSYGGSLCFSYTINQKNLIGSYTRTKAQAPVQQRSEWNESTKDLGIMPLKLGYADVGRQARF
ncbi:hypothetical protein P4529_19095, partial [Virgibacillus pantothenticus]|uniref:hypothetical protein n=1 Tax=Virgibacillus pantothenticus TaxID=1473 RepID=UPI002E1AE42B|nr:hypothetical protein [Virgibacillus pantothenticus]